MHRMLHTLVTLVSLVAISAAPTTLAQSYPTKPIKLVLPFSGGADPMARALAKDLTELLGQQVIVENLTGGQTLVGTEAVARAPGDGHTLLMTTNAITINHVLRKDLRYDLFRDFVPVTQLCWFSLMLAVHPSVPAATLGELVAHAKSNPGKLAYGASGPLYQLPMEMLKSATGTDIVFVPYKASPQARLDLMSGQLQVLMDGVVSMAPLAKANKVRGIAVAGTRRSVVAPDLPTIADSGIPGFSGDGWLGLFAPAGTPSEVVQRIYSETAKILARPEVQKQYRESGNDPTATPPAEFAAFVKRDTEKWGGVIRDAGIRPE